MNRHDRHTPTHALWPRRGDTARRVRAVTRDDRTAHAKADAGCSSRVDPGLRRGHRSISDCTSGSIDHAARFHHDRDGDERRQRRDRLPDRGAAPCRQGRFPRASSVEWIAAGGGYVLGHTGGDVVRSALPERLDHVSWRERPCHVHRRWYRRHHGGCNHRRPMPACTARLPDSPGPRCDLRRGALTIS
jgi:hypothetical protein